MAKIQKSLRPTRAETALIRAVEEQAAYGDPLEITTHDRETIDRCVVAGWLMEDDGELYLTIEGHEISSMEGR